MGTARTGPAADALRIRIVGCQSAGPRRQGWTIDCWARTGVRVFAALLGTLNFGGGTTNRGHPDGARRARCGPHFVDTADVYHAGESERIVGKALAGRRTRSSSRPRSTAGPAWGRTTRGTRASTSCARARLAPPLGTDYIDLYQVTPASPEVPADETLGALTDLVRAGKVRYIGCSTQPAWMVMEALAVSERMGPGPLRQRAAAVQPPRPEDRERTDSVRPAVRPRHPAVGAARAGRAGRALPGGGAVARRLPRDPAAGTGEHLRGSRDAPRARRGAGVHGPCAAHGRTPGQLALLWCKDQPGVTSPIVGPRTEEQLAGTAAGARSPPRPTSGSPATRWCPRAASGDQLPQHRPLDEDTSHEAGVHSAPRDREDHALPTTSRPASSARG